MTSKYWFRRRSRSRLTLPGRLRASTIVRVTIPSGRSFMKALDKGKVQLRKVDSAVREEVEKIQSLRIIWIEKLWISRAKSVQASVRNEKPRPVHAICIFTRWWKTVSRPGADDYSSEILWGDALPALVQLKDPFTTRGRGVYTVEDRIIFSIREAYE
ncbi:hypothetical protein CRG98_043203 [Punica granatum]|uniref:Uncharacterized protein n=1 Tax=Punica granatum TaxID=22663 RepID=A0A2I0HXJ8_PUNGR|nr:hypothetical protein CRG98_043203 [Punica granatum]